jgi:amino acid permease
MPFVFLALPGKENNRPVQHIFTTPFGVFLMPCVFFALPGKKTADLCNTFLLHPLVCILCRLCSLHCLLKKNNRPVQHILTTPSGVF